MPFFSIICVSYNDEKNIISTINSILEQDFDDYEIIIKDACSKDNTVKNIPQSDKIKIYITPDEGIYYGMNEAIGYASGKYLLFLNCGDCLFDKDVLKKIYRYANENSADKNSVIYGDYFTNHRLSKLPGCLTKKFLFRRPLCHQTMFFDAELFKNFGLYDVSLKLLADYDFTLKTFTSKVNYFHSGIIVCNYLNGGVSTSNDKLINKEYKEVKKRYFGNLEFLMYGLGHAVTLPKLRKYFSSSKSPKIIRKIYALISNKINS